MKKVTESEPIKEKKDKMDEERNKESWVCTLGV